MYPRLVVLDLYQFGLIVKVINTWKEHASEILIFGLVLACIGSGVNKVTVDFGADINNELSCRKQDISVR